eukprot:TRINITY_DN40775_c0_g1_i1.p1 TRINITY_DN40775_c0_g1~~TRINITY_DN40775_c0_g1_i1.p1  ORF type:complete len:436 (+),score=77.82 TRINITY_DN40775_c0_g1_i1:265-1572(+)
MERQLACSSSAYQDNGAGARCAATSPPPQPDGSFRCGHEGWDVASSELAPSLAPERREVVNVFSAVGLEWVVPPCREANPALWDSLIRFTAESLNKAGLSVVPPTDSFNAIHENVDVGHVSGPSGRGAVSTWGDNVGSVSPVIDRADTSEAEVPGAFSNVGGAALSWGFGGSDTGGFVGSSGGDWGSNDNGGFVGERVDWSSLVDLNGGVRSNAGEAFGGATSAVSWGRETSGPHTVSVDNEDVPACSAASPSVTSWAADSCGENAWPSGGSTGWFAGSSAPSQQKATGGPSDKDSRKGRRKTRREVQVDCDDDGNARTRNANREINDKLDSLVAEARVAVGFTPGTQGQYDDGGLRSSGGGGGGGEVSTSNSLFSRIGQHVEQVQQKSLNKTASAYTGGLIKSVPPQVSSAAMSHVRKNPKDAMKFMKLAAKFA